MFGYKPQAAFVERSKDNLELLQLLGRAECHRPPLPRPPVYSGSVLTPPHLEFNNEFGREDMSGMRFSKPFPFGLR